ncbi:hypothetical protein ACIF85_13110 [Streptomyces sp. NPDC086033]|uniref:acyl-CoA-like ligand-binding transcription factor n=1 Tax=Streptomyces sp. NPDC086033 TaxID=3365747 RepID=UPI0037D484F1
MLVDCRERRLRPGGRGAGGRAAGVGGVVRGARPVRSGDPGPAAGVCGGCGGAGRGRGVPGFAGGRGSPIGRYHEDPAGALTTTRLVYDTPSLRARHLEKQHSWRPALAEALADRAGSDGSPAIALAARAGAALNCLNIALEYWTASDGRLDLVALLDEAFASLKG